MASTFCGGLPFNIILSFCHQAVKEEVRLSPRVITPHAGTPLAPSFKKVSLEFQPIFRIGRSLPLLRSTRCKKKTFYCRSGSNYHISTPATKRVPLRMTEQQRSFQNKTCVYGFILSSLAKYIEVSNSYQSFSSWGEKQRGVCSSKTSFLLSVQCCFCVLRILL